MALDPGSESYLNSVGGWISKKFKYHLSAQENTVKQRVVNLGEIWYCDLGVNVGDEKNKRRPVLVLSNNKVNRTAKVIVACITDAKGKVKQGITPIYNTWHLLFSTTTNPQLMFRAGRTIPRNTPTYTFLDKDSIVQCEDIRYISKARLDLALGPIGNVDPSDLVKIKEKVKKVFDIT